MALTVLNPTGGFNTYSTNTTGGTVPGDAATGHFERYIDEWVDALAPYETPLYSSIGVGKEIDQQKPEWGQSYQTPHVSATAEAVSIAETAIDVTSGHGVRFHPYHVIKFLEDASGNAEEIAWVQSVSGDTLTVVKAQGGTSDLAHDSGTVIEIIGVAVPQNTDFPKGPITYGDLAYNYFQRFADGLQMDDAERNTPNLEFKGDQLLTQMDIKARDLKILVEKAIVRGGRQAGSADPSAKRGSMMGGLPSFLTTNATNLTDNVLSLYDIETELRDLWNSVGSNAAKSLLMSMNTAAILDSLPNPYRQYDNNTRDVNLTMNSMTFRTGRYSFMVSRYVPDGEIWGVDMSALKLHPYKGLNWHTKVHATDGDHSWHSISADLTLIVKRESAMFRLYNFDTNLDNYPRKSFI